MLRMKIWTYIKFRGINWLFYCIDSKFSNPPRKALEARLWRKRNVTEKDRKDKITANLANKLNLQNLNSTNVNVPIK